MDLDLIPLGWVHSVACLVALAAGAYVFGTRKGTLRHRQVGWAYLVSMVVLNVTALGVYRLGTFFFPHYLAIGCLVLIAIGWGAGRLIRRHGGWRYVHLSAMILSYYVLIGGGVNEVFLRVEALRPILTREGPQLVGMTHGVVMLVFLILLLGWNAAEITRMVLRRRRRGPVAV
jgi:uncharacterized membrane protein